MTDNGNVLLDVYHLKIRDAVSLEAQLNNLEGVVANGICAKRPADIVLLATPQGIIQEA